MSSTAASSLRRSLDVLVRRPVAVELGAVVALLVSVYAGTIALDALLDPYFLDSDTSLLLVRSVLLLAGMGVLAASLAAWRDYSLGVSIPDRADRRVVGAAVAGTALLATLPFSLLALQTGTGVDHVASTVADLGGVFSTRTLIRISLFVPAMTLLYHGVVQGALRHAFGDGRDRVVVTTLFGGYLAAPTVATYGTFANGPWLSLWGGRAAVAVLFVVALGAAVVADGRVVDDRLRVLTRLPVLAAVALALLALAAVTDSPGDALVVATRAAVIGVAAAGFDATDSLVVPALVYATFAAVSSVLYVSTLAAAFGA